MKPFPRPVLALLAASWAVFTMVPPAAAQPLVGRIAGSVKTITGQPIKAATIHAVNPTAIPSEFTATSDQKGEWAILGLRGGLWEVTASAPGFESSSVATRIAMSMNNPKVEFVLVGAPIKGTMDGVDTKKLQASLSAAESLMLQEKWEEAAAEYPERPGDGACARFGESRPRTRAPDEEGLRRRVGGVRRVAEEGPPNQKALLGLGRTQYEKGDRTAAIATFEQVIAIDQSAPEAAEARAALDETKK